MSKILVKKLRAASPFVSALKNQKTPVGYAALKAEDKIKSALKKQEEELSDKKHALVSKDKSDNIMFDEKGNFQFTPEKHKELLKFIEVQGEQEVDYEPYFATSIKSIENDPALLDILNGIVVDVDMEKIYLSEEPETK